MYTIFLPSLNRATDAAGVPISGARMYFYRSGSLILKSVYNSSSSSTPMTNPVVADSTGMFPTVFLDPSTVYRVQITNSSGSVIRSDADPVYVQDLNLVSSVNTLNSQVTTINTTLALLSGSQFGGMIAYPTWSALTAAYAAYAGGTTYSKGTIVVNQDAWWTYINATPGAGNAPPTLPTTSNAYWQIKTQLPGGLIAQVPITDAGTHTDPVVGGTVNNTGVFRWSVSPVGWQRIFNTEAALAKPYSDLASHFANDSTDVAVPGQADTTARGAKYWSLQSAASATTSATNAASIVAIGPDLKTAIKESQASLTTGMADSLSAERMLDPVTFIDKIDGVDSVGRGTRSYKAVKTFGYNYVSGGSTDTTVLLRNGQQHLLIPNSDGNSLYIGNTTKRTTIAGYGPEGNYGACLDTRMPLSGQTWTSVGSGWTTTVTIRNPLNFSGAANIAGIHLMLWNVPSPHDDVLGSLFALKIGGANPAANDTAVDATSGVDAWSIKYSGQTAGDIRGTGYTGSSLILHVKLADGSNPNGKPLFLADFASGVNLTAGAHGHVLIIGTTGKDSANFAPMGNVSLGQIPWFESLTMLGVGGHGGVGPKCTVGDFRAVGVPIPGENTYSVGQTGGGGCHNFSAGFDLSNQYLYNGSIHVDNFGVAGCYAHGSGGGGEAYRGWNVGGDIVQNNCTSGFEIEITLNEGFKHYGRLILKGGQTGVNSYPGQYFQLAGRGGLFAPGNYQATLASFTGGGARTTVIGSDDPSEIFVLDAALVNAASPDFHAPKLYARTGSDTDPAPTLILKHVEDHTVVVPGVTNKFQIPDTGFDPNNPYVNLTLIGSKLGDMWPLFDFAPHWPKSLYVDGNSQIGFYGRTWAAIEAAMAALGNPCTILPGAKAVNNLGVVVDIK